MADELENQPDPGEPAGDPEPEGVVELQGQKVVPLAALTAERERVRTRTEEKIRAEFAPVQQKAAQADQLAADLAQVQPYIEHLRRHPELMQEQQPPAPPIPDEEAERFARDYELYTPTGLDLGRAKRIIAKQKAEITAASREAASEAVRPMLQTTATQAARQNFVWAASQVGQDGQPLVDPQHLAQVWATFPAEMIADPAVAREVLKNVVGEAYMSGRRRQGGGPEPVFSETPGGNRGQGYRISPQEQRLARNVGLDDKQWSKAASEYKPDAVNILGD